MFFAIDQLARIIGYITLGYCFWRLATMWLKDRRTMRVSASDRAWLDRLKIEQPDAYEKELWRRNNRERLQAGLPTDPDYIAEMRRLTEVTRQAGLIDDR